MLCSGWQCNLIVKSFLFRKIFDRPHSRGKYLDWWRTVHIGQLGQEVEVVVVLAAGGLGQPAEEGQEEEEEVDHQRHPHHLPPPPGVGGAEAPARLAGSLTGPQLQPLFEPRRGPGAPRPLLPLQVLELGGGGLEGPLYDGDGGGVRREVAPQTVGDQPELGESLVSVGQPAVPPTVVTDPAVSRPAPAPPPPPPLVLAEQAPQLNHLGLEQPQLGQEVLGPGDVAHGGVVGPVPQLVQLHHLLLQVGGRAEPLAGPGAGVERGQEVVDGEIQVEELRLEVTQLAHCLLQEREL